ENGCVIQLAAAVSVGQLVFLTNKESGKEIVTQVLRKRSFRPTDCYVELEFTEAAPDFWGQEFPEIDTQLKISVDEGSEAASVADAELTEDDAQQTVAAPDSAEIAKLKQEVEALRAQLKSAGQTLGQTAPADSAMQEHSAGEIENLKSLLQPKAATAEPVEE